MNCSPPGFSVHGITQARTLEWVAISYSKASSQPRDQTCVFCVSRIGRKILYYCATWEACLLRIFKRINNELLLLTVEVWDAYRNVCKHTAWHTCIKWTLRVTVPRSRNTTGLAPQKHSPGLLLGIVQSSDHQPVGECRWVVPIVELRVTFHKRYLHYPVCCLPASISLGLMLYFWGSSLLLLGVIIL